MTLQRHQVRGTLRCVSYRCSPAPSYLIVPQLCAIMKPYLWFSTRPQDEEFWGGPLPILPLQPGTVPALQQNVLVLGYPTGGDNTSITSGVVSRVEVAQVRVVISYRLSYCLPFRWRSCAAFSAVANTATSA